MQKKRAANDEIKKVTEPSERASERREAQVEFEIALDPGPDLDPDGWMAERRDYWFEQAQSQKPQGIQRWIAALRAILARLSPSSPARRRTRLERDTELSHEDWARLSESALGPLRPVRQDFKDCGLPGALHARKALPSTWKAGELMRPQADDLSMRAAESDEEPAAATMSDVGPDAPQAVAPPSSAPRRRRP